MITRQHCCCCCCCSTSLQFCTNNSSRFFPRNRLQHKHSMLLSLPLSFNLVYERENSREPRTFDSAVRHFFYETLSLSIILAPFRGCKLQFCSLLLRSLVSFAQLPVRSGVAARTSPGFELGPAGLPSWPVSNLQLLRAHGFFVSSTVRFQKQGVFFFLVFPLVGVTHPHPNDH